METITKEKNNYFDVDIWNNLEENILKSDEQVNDKSMIYDITKHDTFCVKSACGMGKTENLINFISKLDPKVKVLTVTFRIVLADKQFDEMSKYGFILYTHDSCRDQGLIYGDRIIVQIDSFYRVRGQFDVLILDEIEYTLAHFVEFSKNKAVIWKTLKSYIFNCKKVICLDALLSTQTVQLLRDLGRNPYVYHNKYKKQKDKTVFLIKNKNTFIKQIKDKINDNKKIVIPSNSETFVNKLYHIITEEFPDKKTKLYTGKNHNGEDPVDEWINYDIILYSPVVTAGLSFKEIHFDLCYAYFTDKSCIAELALQQIFRVRNLNSGLIYICISNYNSNYIKCYNIDQIKDWVINNHRILNNSTFQYKGLQKACKLLSIDNYSDSIDEKDPYFNIYCNVLNMYNNSRRSYVVALMSLLKQMGVNYGGLINDILSDGSSYKMKNMEELIDNEYYNNISSAKNISYEQYKHLKYKRYKTPEDKFMIIKFNLSTGYKIDTNLITVDFVRVYHNLLEKKDRLQMIISVYQMNISNTIKYIEKFISDHVKNHNLKDNIIDILHDDEKKMFLKVYYGLSLLWSFGFSHPFDKSALKDCNSRIKSITEYIITNKNKLVNIFECQCDINTETLNYVILRWVNNILLTLWDIKIKRPYKGNCHHYVITGLEKWSIHISKENIILMPKLSVNFKRKS